MQKKNSFRSSEAEYQKFAQAAKASRKTLSKFYRDITLMSSEFISSNQKKAIFLNDLFKLLNRETDLL